MKCVAGHEFSSSLYSAVNFAYSSILIRFSTSPASVTWIFAIHPSPSGLLFIVPGFSCSTSFASIIFPDTGVKISDADLTDSTAPMESPADTSRSMAGNSTKTTSPRLLAAKTDTPMVPEEDDALKNVQLAREGGECGRAIPVLPSSLSSIHSCSAVYFFSCTMHT